MASWFVVFFIVASWSILFRALSPLIFGTERRVQMVLTMNDDLRGDLCVARLGPAVEAVMAETEDRPCPPVILMTN